MLTLTCSELWPMPAALPLLSQDGSFGLTSFTLQIFGLRDASKWEESLEVWEKNPEATYLLHCTLLKCQNFLKPVFSQPPIISLFSPDTVMLYLTLPWN